MMKIKLLDAIVKGMEQAPTITIVCLTFGFMVHTAVRGFESFATMEREALATQVTHFHDINRATIEVLMELKESQGHVAIALARLIDAVDRLQ